MKPVSSDACRKVFLAAAITLGRQMEMILDDLTFPRGRAVLRTWLRGSSAPNGAGCQARGGRPSWDSVRGRLAAAAGMTPLPQLERQQMVALMAREPLLGDDFHFVDAHGIH